MSLFEDNRFEYRDTFFVFFRAEKRPSREDIEALIKKLGSRYQAKDLRDDEGKFDSVCILSPQDYSAMDIVCVDGDDVREKLQEIIAEFKTMTLTKDDRQRIGQIAQADCRFDVFHFGQVSDSGDGDDDFLDPGGLMAVLELLAELTDGVGYDPQSQALV